MSSFHVRPLGSLSALEPLASAWEALAGDVPFRAPTWLLTWWKHFGEADPGARSRRRLFALAVEQGDRLVALAPWYLERTPLGGSVVRPLGSGMVCSDYLNVPCATDDRPAAAQALADYLCDTARTAWDRIDLDAAVLGDPLLAPLYDELAARGAELERRPGINCWRIALPPTWDEYLAMLSKSHRKQLRRLAERTLDTPRAAWHTTRHGAEFDRDWTMFIDLHQRRRRRLGDVGCFSDRAFAAFHEDVARRLLLQGRLRLHRLELDGRPVAAEYHVVGGNAVYAYQSGLEPDALDDEPGRLASIAVIRNAIAAGASHYDLLRGDEPYKAHWRAVPTPTENVSIASPRTSSRLRFALRRRARKVRTTLGKPN